MNTLKLTDAQLAALYEIINTLDVHRLHHLLPIVRDIPHLIEESFPHVLEGMNIQLPT